MAQKRVLTRGAADPAALVPLLMARLQLSQGAARALVSQGAVFLGGQRCLQEGAAVPLGAPLRVFLPDAGPVAALGAPGAPSIPIIYEDDDLLVVDKPAGLLSQPGPSGGASVLSEVALGEKRHLCHRLDREASGLLLLVRPELAGAIQRDLDAGALRRGYLALARGVVAPSDPAREHLITLRIARAAHDARLRQALPAAASGGQPAQTRYRALAQLSTPAGPATLLALILDSGRTHQIRVHLSALGHPLLGDEDYGGPPAPRLLLHAAWLALRHPRTGAALRLRRPAPFPEPFWPAQLPRDPGDTPTPGTPW